MSQYNPYLNPFGFQPIQQVQPPAYQPPSKQVDKVNGRNGAMQYPVGPNGQAWILDESGEISWLIITDSAGYRTVTPYDISPHQDAPPPDYGSLETRIKRLEDMIHGNNATDSAAAWQKQHHPVDSAGPANDEHGAYGPEPGAHAEPTRYEQPAAEAGNGYHPAVRGRFNESAA